MTYDLDRITPHFFQQTILSISVNNNIIILC